MTTDEKRALRDELLEHIWYTTKTNPGGGGQPRRTVVVCKCMMHFPDSDAHAGHVTSVALRFLGRL